MSNLKKTSSLSSLTTLMVILLAAPSAWSQVPDDCTLIGSGASGLNIAVASNFYKPAQWVAQAFIDSTAPPPVNAINVCHNASGTLVNEINAGNKSDYALFLAANDVFPDDITPTYKDGASFPYTVGVPVLYSRIVASSAQLLDANNHVNQSTVTSLAIADPSVAPYGQAANDILDEMGQWVTPDVAPACYSSGTSWICQYSNIDLTYQAVYDAAPSPPASGVPVAGFVAKSQICPITPSTVFQEFDAMYNLNQSGTKVLVGGSSVALAQTFQTFLLSPTIQQGLQDNFCYGSLTKTAKAKAAMGKAPAKKK